MTSDPPTTSKPAPAAELRAAWSARLAAAREAFAAEARAGRGGRLAHARFALALDELVADVTRRAAAETSTPWVVAAVGGYGRRTLCLHSDLDLLIAFDAPIGEAEERFVKAVLQPLWDLKLTVGHHIRELADFDVLDDGNPEYLMALCDIRLLVGDVRLFDDVCARIHRGDADRAERLVQVLLPLIDERYAEFNHTVYQLEPDVKKAPGGLRDVAAIRLLRLLAREAFATRPRLEGERLDEAEEFLFRVRAVLHLEASRDTNILTHELQETVAGMLGAAGADPRQQVESLMSDYFRHARGVVQALAWTRAVIRPPQPIAEPGRVTEHVRVARHGPRRCRSSGSRPSRSPLRMATRCRMKSARSSRPTSAATRRRTSRAPKRRACGCGPCSTRAQGCRPVSARCSTAGSSGRSSRSSRRSTAV
jgi:UTP:GlnB (protein PII) uridylyltransferase